MPGFLSMKNKSKNPWNKFKRPKYNPKLSHQENSRLVIKARKQFIMKNKKELEKWKASVKLSFQNMRKSLKKRKNTQNNSNNKNKSKKCCKCRYIKKGETLRKVRGPWSHCSYDVSNCCKDKKTIIG